MSFSNLKDHTLKYHISFYFRDRQKIVFRDINELNEVSLTYSVAPHKPGSLCTESPTTLLFLDESSTPRQLKRLDCSISNPEIGHNILMKRDRLISGTFEVPCRFKDKGCPKVLTNHSNYLAHIQACGFQY